MAETEAREKVKVRELLFEDKVEYYKEILADYDNTNEVDILNIFRLVNSYNIFDDKFFEGDESYVTSISEFIDLKMELANEIQTFSADMVKWYLSLLASCGLPLSPPDESEVKIPGLIYGVFLLADLPFIANLMRKIKWAFSVSDLYIVKDGFSIVSKLFGNHAILNSFLEKI